MPQHDPSTVRAAAAERAGSGLLRSWTIDFGSGRQATAVAAPPDVSGEDAAAALALPPPRGVVVLNGGTNELEADLEAALRRMLGDGLARVVVDERLTVVTGATDAGIFALFGQALEARRTAPCVGVAPLARVTWPGHEGASGDAVPLEPHHSHFLLVEGEDWGDETAAMLALVAALDARSPSVAVLAGGGEGAKRELAGHERAGREVIVLAGSGRCADETAEAASEGDPGAMRVTSVDLACPPSDLADAVRASLVDQRSRPAR